MNAQLDLIAWINKRSGERNRETEAESWSNVLVLGGSESIDVVVSSTRVILGGVESAKRKGARKIYRDREFVT